MRKVPKSERAKIEGWENEMRCANCELGESDGKCFFLCTVMSNAVVQIRANVCKWCFLWGEYLQSRSAKMMRIDQKEEEEMRMRMSMRKFGENYI
jgi:hypothetical protein